MPFEKGNPHGVRATKGNKLAVKHSLHTFRRLLSGGKVDGRTSLHRVLREKEQELITALGGDPSPQERLIIADAVKTMLYVGTLDEYLMKLDGHIVRNNKVISVIDTRTSLAAHLRRDLEALGLKRISKELSLTDYIEQKYGNKKVDSEGDQPDGDKGVNALE